MKHLFFSAALAVLLGGCAPSPEAPRMEGALAKASFAGAELSRAPAPGADQGPYQSPQQIKTGSVTLETGDLGAAEAALTDQTTAAGGFVEHSRASEASRSLTLRIPAAAFDGFLKGLGSVGKVSDQQIDVTDVTVQYYDLETRIKNQRLLLDQYRTLLAQAKKMEDTLAAMERMSALTTEIEAAEGQFRYLARQIGYSTLQVELVQPLLAEGRTWPDAGRAFADLVHGLADFGVGLVIVLVWALLLVPTAVAVIFFMAWLWVGKPGLWRRLKSLKKS